MFSYKIFRQGSDTLLAVCDEDIINKTFSSGGVEITISDFYQDKICSKEEILSLAKKSTVINAVGNKIIKLLIEKKIVESSSVLKIGNVMHAQVVSVGD